MAKVAKEGVSLVSSEGTGYCYTIRRNKKKQKGEKKLKVRKYDPIARAHALYTETKKSLGRHIVKDRKQKIH